MTNLLTSLISDDFRINQEQQLVPTELSYKQLARYKSTSKEPGKYYQQIIEIVGGNISYQIRTLYDLGFTKMEISNMMGKRYQHVRNVLLTPLKTK